MCIFLKINLAKRGSFSFGEFELGLYCEGKEELMNQLIHPDAKALIFDIDGTLVDTMPTHYQAWHQVLLQKGIHYPEEVFYEYAGIPTNTITQLLNKRFGYQLDIAEIFSLKNQAYIEKIFQVKPIEPITNLVFQYNGKLPMALGTGETREIATLNIKAAKLESYFQIIVTADDVINPKPDPETFLKCAALMQVAPRNCQVFEDSDKGLIAARNAGMIATDVRPFL